MKFTLCGSARFEKEFKWANEKLTMQGHTVYGLAVYASDKAIITDAKDGIIQADAPHEWYTTHEKEILDLVHLSKIMNSDAIYVINKDAYIGASTKREVNWALILEKQVYFHSMCVRDDDLNLIETTPHLITRVSVTPLTKQARPGV